MTLYISLPSSAGYNHTKFFLKNFDVFLESLVQIKIYTKPSMEWINEKYISYDAYIYRDFDSVITGYNRPSKNELKSIHLHRR